MSNDWKNFVVTIKYVTDLNGKKYFYQIPPSWKTELQIWEILENSSDLEVHDFESALSAVDTVCQIIGILLFEFPVDGCVEDCFDSSTIEQIFADIWQSIQGSSPQAIQELAGKSLPTTKTDDFSMASALAMFACECGWTPDQVLSLPKIQVIQLTSAISEHTSQRMKFHAAIHGVPISDDSSGTPIGAQINIEDQINEFRGQGLPVEVM